jgi:proline iminopeptidase
VQYVDNVLRIPADQWPVAVKRALAAINMKIHVPTQGASELGAGGLLLDWDRTADLPSITVATLGIGAQHDTMYPLFMRSMAGVFPHGEYLHCANGSHMTMLDRRMS